MFYTGIGGRYQKGSPEHARYAKIKKVFADSEEIISQEGLFSQKGVERIMRYFFELARKRKKHLTSCTKSNTLNYSMVYWDEVFRRVSKQYPDVETNFAFIDAICMWFVKNPERFDVIVAPNLFGDIITDLGAIIQGGMGLAPGANINPHGISMFEPIHGSAPKYTSKDVANPVASIWAAQMMLEELREIDAAKRIMNAIEEVLREGRIRTKDLGGSSRTSEMGDVIAETVRNLEY